MNKREVGSKKEQLAARYLEQRGMQILEQNFRSRQGEIDLIARDQNTIVFIEVKYRRNTDMGYPEEAVGLVKQRTICKVADYYRVRKGMGDFVAVRFDVVAICGEEIKWIPNAFCYIR